MAITGYLDTLKKRIGGGMNTEELKRNAGAADMLAAAALEKRDMVDYARYIALSYSYLAQYHYWKNAPVFDQDVEAS
jgi:hypothetical protein